MSRFTGNPSKGTFKRFGKALLDGLDAMATVSHDAPLKTRIAEIDALIPELLQERDHAINGLYEAGDLKVSENFNPNWVKTDVEKTSVESSIFADIPGDGRLTKCKGRWSETSTMHDAHPGCPYLATKHNAHEFTLRD